MALLSRKFMAFAKHAQLRGIDPAPGLRAQLRQLGAAQGLPEDAHAGLSDQHPAMEPSTGGARVER